MSPAVALTDALASSLGFGLVICLVSALREIASSGTLWDIPLDIDLRASGGGAALCRLYYAGLHGRLPPVAQKPAGPAGGKIPRLPPLTTARRVRRTDFPVFEKLSGKDGRIHGFS